MKDGRTHLAHKAEHAVDLETGALVGVTVQAANQGDTTTIAETLTTAAEALEAVARVTDDHTGVIDEVVADKGYHSNQVLTDLAALDLRSYIAEPDRGRRHWTKKAMARTAVYANRRRIRGARGRAVLRRRSEHLERPNANPDPAIAAADPRVLAGQIRQLLRRYAPAATTSVGVARPFVSARCASHRTGKGPRGWPNWIGP